MRSKTKNVGVRSPVAKRLSPDRPLGVRAEATRACFNALHKPGVGDDGIDGMLSLEVVLANKEKLLGCSFWGTGVGGWLLVSVEK